MNEQMKYGPEYVATDFTVASREIDTRVAQI